MAVGTPTTAEGVTTSSFPIAVPAGVASDDIVLSIITGDGAGYTFTQPSGFTSLVSNAVTSADGQISSISWKRLTGADSGNYTWTDVSGGNRPYAAAVIPLTGRHATDPPVVSTTAVQNTSQTSPMTITANGVTAVAGDDLIFFSAPDVRSITAGAGHSSWDALFTEILDIENNSATGQEWQNIGAAKAENVSAGATGTRTVTFTCSGGSLNEAGWHAWIVRVPSGAPPAVPVITPDYRSFPKFLLRK